MFSAIASTPKSRRAATLCSAALHAAAVVLLWTVGQTVKAPAPQYEPREAVTVISAPPRLFRPRTIPKAPVQRFVVERAPVPRMPEAVLPAQKAPTIEMRAAPTPAALNTPEVVVPNPTTMPAGFAGAVQAPAPKLELEPRATAFGVALGRPSTTSVVPPGVTAGFGAVGLAKVKSPPARGGEGGFGGVEIGRAERHMVTPAEAGFGAAARSRLPPSSANAAAPAANKNRPVKILWKPVPQYSEEGISRRIEGDVVLLVRFLAQGTVETLRIVSGLGHGLDEYALEAAQAIRFEPAVEDDRPTDYTAQVRIRFELAY